MVLGLSWKFCKKTFCLTFDWSSLILDQSSQIEMHNEFCNSSIPTLHKTHTLIKFKTRLKTYFDHALPTIQIRLLIHQFLSTQNLTRREDKILNVKLGKRNQCIFVFSLKRERERERERSCYPAQFIKSHIKYLMRRRITYITSFNNIKNIYVQESLPNGALIFKLDLMFY